MVLELGAVEVVVEVEVVEGTAVVVVVGGGGPDDTSMSTELPGDTEDPVPGLEEMTSPAAY